MPRKKYEERIKKGLAELRADKEIQEPLFDLESPADEVGDIFQIVADGVALFEQKKHP